MDLASDLDDATHRLVRTVDRLTDPAYAEPSLLPGWTRAHVVAHLALNAEALAGVLVGVRRGEPVAMYPSAQSRDADIETLAVVAPTVLRDRLLASTTALAAALADLPATLLDTVVERTPGSERTFAAGEVVVMRLHEVEIHHVDLGAGYTPSAWGHVFATLAVERLHARAAATLVATDVGRSWQAGDARPTVTGTAAALAWWLSGRGGGEGLTSDGELPGIEAW